MTPAITPELRERAGKDRPIIFSAPMVRALIAGRMKQTRRILKPQPDHRPELHEPSTDDAPFWCVFNGDEIAHRVRVPYAVGDRLWVKENWRTSRCCDDRKPSSMEVPGGGYGWPVWYEADGGAVTWRGATDGGPGFVNPGKLRPSIHMPRWASRLTLLVTDVRVERLASISREDAIAEGIQRVGGGVLRWENWSGAEGQSGTSPEAAFALLWNSINGADAWDANPWVVAVSFQPFETNIDRMPERQAAPVPAAAE